ncbi:MAG TPA: flagellar motor switch protein FliM [Synergistales bacterium]|nr:flagellar motor switch protein FliM [Synergistales bacterium]HRV71082.1 flagellar motor switch protein FliM [Thermovirgaceae bacterium]
MDVLNQAEIDRLIGALASGEKIEEEDVSEKAVKTYDFRRPNKFNRDQLRAVQMLHESFARHLTSKLSAMSRIMVSAEIATVEQIPYEEFMRSVIAPTTLAILDVSPYGGKSLLEVSQFLVFALLDRMLGGGGQPLNRSRDCTDLEKVVVDKVLETMVEGLNESWKAIREDFMFSVFGRESNPFFVQIVPKSEMVLLVNIKVQVGTVEGHLNLCFPYHCMEPVIDRFNPQEWFVARDKSYSDGEKEILRKRVSDVRVDLRAELCETSLTLNEISNLCEGDVINLGRPVSGSGILKVGSIPKFSVVFGTSGDRTCARISGVLPPQERDYYSLP